MYYTVLVAFEREVQSGKGTKMKIEKERFLVSALSTAEAEANAVAFLEGSDSQATGPESWEIKSIAESRIVAVIPAKSKTKKAEKALSVA